MSSFVAHCRGGDDDVAPGQLGLDRAGAATDDEALTACGDAVVGVTVSSGEDLS
jgi:hypothetical protein